MSTSVRSTGPASSRGQDRLVANALLAMLVAPVLYFIWRYAELTCKAANHIPTEFAVQIDKNHSKTVFVCPWCYKEANDVSEYILKASAVKH